MVEQQAPGEAKADEGPILPRRRVEDTAEMDITPMIDIVFLLLIFFIVCSTVARQTGVKLPKARHGTAVDASNAVVITVDDEGSGGKPTVSLDEGRAVLPANLEDQEEAIEQAVRSGLDAGKSAVLIKAAKTVKHGEVSRVAEAASQVEGIELHLAVLETR